jgi:hypothetical protein
MFWGNSYLVIWQTIAYHTHSAPLSIAPQAPPRSRPQRPGVHANQLVGGKSPDFCPLFIFPL